MFVTDNRLNNRKLWPVRLVLIAVLAILAVTEVDAGSAGTKILSAARVCSAHFGNDAPWFVRNIPLFECSDPQITRIYYYRWELYKAHLKDIGQRGYIVTEFLDDVGWAWNPYQSLNDATAFHINEGRWLRDNWYLDNYINYMYSGGNDRHFSEAITAAVYGRYLANGDRALAIQHLSAMTNLFERWSDHYDAAKGLYFIEPIADATEYSIASIDASGGKDGFLHGEAFRPTINSFMYANARAISALGTLAGDASLSRAYAAKAEAIKAAVQTCLWNEGFDHFVDRFKANNQFVHYWDYIRGRELAGYVPWSFELPDNDARYSRSWHHLLRADEFAGPHGLRTVEPAYQYYMRQYRYAEVNGQQRPECQWNGPTWPFDTTLVLQGLANLLNDYDQDMVHASDYLRLLKQYTGQHFLHGQPDLQEDYSPDTGNVIVGLPRSHHYNHSAYNDLIITGLAGLRPRADDLLEINPLIPVENTSADSLDYFCLENVPYHGHLVTILYDRSGRHYGRGKGVTIYVDGVCELRGSPLGRTTIALSAPQTTPLTRTVDLAVNFAKTGFPFPSASVNNAANELYQAVDGRVWFFPNVRNYWSNEGSTETEDWYQLDFGSPLRLGSVRLYFYADGVKFQSPRRCTVQYWTDGGWVNGARVRKSPFRPLANGENVISFSPVNTSKLRVVFANPRRASIALVEIKAFDH
jgi:hypothetical protein